MDLTLATDTLSRGGVVAVPTESSYGLLADATCPAALTTLLAIKPRGADKGQPLMVPSEAVWKQVASVDEPRAELLARQFWPGPLTLVTKARPGVDERVLLDGTVAVRVPGACLARDLVVAYGKPVTATSANSPGEAPCLTSTEVHAAFSQAVREGRLCVVEGRAPGGPPSTLVKVEGGRWSLLREGAIAQETLQRVLNVAASVFRPEQS